MWGQTMGPVSPQSVLGMLIGLLCGVTVGANGLMCGVRVLNRPPALTVPLPGLERGAH